MLYIDVYANPSSLLIRSRATIFRMPAYAVAKPHALTPAMIIIA
jgi:hypothetical protein